MNDRDEMEKVRDTIDTALSGLKDDPWLAQKVLAEAKGRVKVRRKISAALVACVVLLMLSVTALAATLLNMHQVEMFEDVTVGDLLPERWRQYDVCHRVSDGYLVGGFELGDDYIAPMSDEDKILYLNESFSPVWVLEDARLDGCLYDKVEEAADAFYFGMERSGEEWGASLMKVGKAGEILWMYEGEKGFRAKDFLVDDDGAVYLVGRDEAENRAALLKLDRDGGLQWKRNFEEVGALTLNALVEWEDGMLAVGQTDRGIALCRIDYSGEVSAHAAYDLDERVDAVSLTELADGRLALILSVNSGSLGEEVTEETKYMIVSEDMFE